MMRRKNMDRLNLAQALGMLALCGVGAVAILGLGLWVIAALRKVLS